MVDVGRQKKIQVNWKFFSLKLINKDREMAEDHRVLMEIGLKVLRAAGAVRAEFGSESVGELYTAMGACYHHDESIGTSIRN